MVLVVLVDLEVLVRRVKVQTVETREQMPFLIAERVAAVQARQVLTGTRELVLVALTNGRYTLQPTDRVVFCDRSFTTGRLEFPRGLKRQDETYSAEGQR